MSTTKDPKHERLRHLFELALAAPEAQRAALIARECAGDDDLARRLEAMVAAALDERFLASPTVSGLDAALPPPLREKPGTRIGPYKLLELIGEGGFGAVFMAEQEKPVARRVALKIIKLGMDTRQVVARFEQERQALALMDHPNIAKVLDAGATEAGRPYFVMDLVQGDPIVAYCDKHSLAIDERLELFAQVCDAVQHAHGRGIIHRDIKPSNILVAVRDGRPHAKIIDFGIAKATSAKLTDKTLFTAHQQVIGTLQYMSPEQAEGSLDIDTRTDVYSLGVLLYELLTGSTPFDKRTLNDALQGEIQRLIREIEPPKPSTRISESQGTLASVAAHRRIEPKRLGLLVRGELDWIVMKALEKDRRRRYETANGLALDIRRHLTGEPVLAAPPSASYRLRKLVRRNKGKVAAAGAVALALLVGLLAFAQMANVARRERDAAMAAQHMAVEQRHRAEEQRAAADAQRSEALAQQRLRASASADSEATARAQAEAIHAFVAEVLRPADPHPSGAQGALAADAMQNAVALLDRGALKDQPEVAMRLRRTIAQFLNGNGRSAEALPVAERALAIARELHTGDHAEVSSSLSLLAEVHRSLGLLAEAETLHRQALEMNQRLARGENPAAAKD